MPRLFSAKLILFLLFVLILDLTFSPIFKFGNTQFILTYLLIIYAAFQWGWKATMPIAILVGIVRDLVGVQLLGLELCSLILATFGLDLVVQKLQRESLLLRMGTAFLFVLSVSLIKFILTLFLSSLTPNYWYYFSVIVGTSIYTALLFPLFFFIAAKWFHDRVTFKQYELFG